MRWTLAPHPIGEDEATCAELPIRTAPIAPAVDVAAEGERAAEVAPTVRAELDHETCASWPLLPMRSM